MKKRESILGMSGKEMLMARYKDKLHHFLMADGNIRGALVHGTHLVKEMREYHQLGILETLILGHGYLAASLMTATFKGIERVVIKIDCSGPVGGVSLEANGYGEVRGYLKNKHIPLDKPLESFDMSPFLGNGLLTVIRYFPDAKAPYEGRVHLQNGSIARDLAFYYSTSEQTPTVFNLSVIFDKEGNVTGAGGLFLQAMPGAEDKQITQLESIVEQLPSIGEYFAANGEAEDFIRRQFKDLSPRIIGQRRIEFFCRCHKENFGRILGNLELDSLEDLAKNGPFPLETRCHYCNSTYTFSKEELQEMYQKRLN
jgi:molecular chaperone Hsp33